MPQLCAGGWGWSLLGMIFNITIKRYVKICELWSFIEAALKHLLRVKSSARATKKKCICKTEPIPDLPSYKFNSKARSRKGKHSHHIGSRCFQIPKLLMTQRKRGSRLNIGFFLEKTLSSGRILNWGSKILASLPENLSAPAILLVILNGKEFP